MKAHRTLVTAIAGTVMLSASGCVWRGFNETVAPTPVVGARTAEPCMTVGTQNLGDADREAVLSIARDVCTIIGSDEFSRQLAGRRLLASCEVTAAGGPDTIDGTRVLQMLRAAHPTFSIVVRKPWRAVGLTDRSRMRVALNPGWVHLADHPRRSTAAQTRGNLAHELTHVVSGDLMDAGHGGDCDEGRLASYLVGDIVEAMYTLGLPRQ